VPRRLTSRVVWSMHSTPRRRAPATTLPPPRQWSPPFEIRELRLDEQQIRSKCDVWQDSRRIWGNRRHPPLRPHPARACVRSDNHAGVARGCAMFCVREKIDSIFLVAARSSGFESPLRTQLSSGSNGTYGSSLSAGGNTGVSGCMVGPAGRGRYESQRKPVNGR
jgi:hypothetical protein